MKIIIKTFILSLFLLSAFADIHSQNINIVPLPQKITVQKGYYNLKNNLKIGISNNSLRDAASYLKGILSATGYRISIVNGKGDINLVATKKVSSDESYTLSVAKNQINIKAITYRGIINGISSLRQLLPDAIESKSVVKGNKWTVPAVVIADKPAFHWRGLMMDVSRHFFNKQEVENFLDLMALYKLNKFHWHITDDQGWRIEIKNYPLLTRNGAWRTENGLDQGCKDRAKNENNPDLEIPKDKFKVVNGDSLYGGYYTQQDIKDIVKFAAIRGIDIIPEIDMPGHETLASDSYPFITCFSKGGPFCPGKNSTLEFCKNIYSEVFKLFPFNYVAIGGDEVDMSNWKKCPDCQKRIKDENLKSESELQAWFTHYMEKFFNDNGKRLIGWDEILEGGLSETSTVDWWRGGITDVAQRTTAHGNEVILCPDTYCYFDHGQDNNTIQRLYEGKVVPEGLTDKQLSLVKGMQANIWAEWIPTVQRQQFMVYPRALALAEKAWTNSDLQNWDSFNTRLQSQIKRLDALHINYRPLDTTKP